MFELHASGEHSLITLRKTVLNELGLRLSRSYCDKILSQKTPFAGIRKNEIASLGGEIGITLILCREVLDRNSVTVLVKCYSGMRTVDRR